MPDELQDQTPSRTDASESVSWRTAALNSFAAWLFRQPPQTVLLFVIVIGGGYSALFHFPTLVENGLNRVEKMFGIATAAYEKDQVRDQQRYESLQRFLEEFIRNQRVRGAIDGNRPIVKNNPAAGDAPL